MSSAPIGIFDSGFGGLSVWKACKDLLPHESFIYVADHAHCPYGPKTTADIQKLSLRIVKYFQRQHAKLIIIACNTATAAAIEFLRTHIDLPFVGMEPAIKPAALQSQTGVIGVLATQGTFQGQHFQRSREAFAQGLDVLVQVGEGLVEQVEAGEIMTEKTLALLRKYLLPMQDKGADHIVLGCTHYPFLLEPIRHIMGSSVHILDPAPAIARQVERLLDKEGINSPNNAPQADKFFTTAHQKMGQTVLKNLQPILKQKIVLSGQLTL